MDKIFKWIVFKIPFGDYVSGKLLQLKHLFCVVKIIKFLALLRLPQIFPSISLIYLLIEEHLGQGIQEWTE